MKWLYAARALGGLLAITTLLGMVVAQFLYPELVIQDSTLYVLILMIGGLLGVDVLLEHGPIQVEIKSGKEDGDDGN